MKTSLMQTGFAIAVAAAGMAAAPAHAQTSCAPRDTVLDRLQSSFGEALAAGGLQSQSQVLEVWASQDTGTWTVLMTNANGLTCVVASGTNWHQNDPKLAVMGVPS